MFQRGQAFDVFKLLIAAIIAVAILAILLPILSRIIFFGQSDPNDAAATLIKNANLGQLKTTEEVLFSKDNAGLISKTIAEKTGSLSRDQVCVSAGDYADETNKFQQVNEQVVNYLGTTNLSAKLSILCDRGTDLQEDFEMYSTLPGVTSAWAEGCTCVDSPEKCCIVAIRK